MLSVIDVEETSRLLQTLFGWKSAHGGAECEDLVDDEGNSVLRLHHNSEPRHERFRLIDQYPTGIGATIYVLVDDVETALARVEDASLEIVEPLFFNKNADFREFTMKLREGHQLTVFEKSKWVNI